MNPLPEEHVDAAVERYLRVPGWENPARPAEFAAGVAAGIRDEVHWRCREEVAIRRFFDRPAKRDAAGAPKLGTVLGGCELIELLGSGGMGTVYRARQLGLDRDVALKIVRAEVSDRVDVLARFRREGAHVARLDHPAIVRVHAFGEQDGLPYYVMDLIEGPSLQQVLAAPADRGAALGTPGTPEYHRGVARVMAGIADALGHAHGRGVVHRDVKPSNVLLDGDGAPHLADFGLAKEVDAPRLTADGYAIGTMAYLSPERLRGDDTRPELGDLWALGVMLYELLHRAHPFESDGALQPDAMLAGTIAPRHNDLPRDLRRIVETALAPDPEDRYPNAGAIGSDLERFLSGRPVHLVAAATLPLRARRHVVRNRRRYVALAVLAAIASGAGIGYDAWSSSRKPHLSIELPRGHAVAEAIIARMNATTDLPEELFRLPLPARARPLEPGLYRITVLAGGQLFEVHRHLERPEDTVVRPALRPHERVTRDMVLVPAGEYVVGIPRVDAYFGERKVRLAGFWIDRTEVTCADYQRFLKAHPGVSLPRQWPDGYRAEWARLPVAGVSFHEAERYAEWVGKRLPTWTEWQAAARGPEGYAYPWGNEAGDPGSRAAVMRPHRSSWAEGTAPVGTHDGDRTPFGVLDMYGNVSEWTASPWREPGAKGRVWPSRRILQGYSWDRPPAGDKRPFRLGLVAAAPAQWSYNGFRCAKTARK